MSPLAGRSLVVTRATEQAASLSRRLAELGADVIELPVIEIGPPSDEGRAMARAIGQLRSYDWVVVTSPNGSRRLLDDLAANGRRLDDIRRIAAIGRRTGAVLASAGRAPDLVPERFVAEGLLESFPAPPEGGGRVLLARAEVARSLLPDGLRAAGWTVDDVAAYRTETAAPAMEVRHAASRADAVTFTSASTVERFVELVDDRPATALCIGPITAGPARAAGFDVRVADEFTIDGLVECALGWAEAMSAGFG